MPRYTIRIDGLDDTTKVDREEDYDVDEQILLAEEGGQVIYDANGEVICCTFPRPVYGTVVAKE